MSKQTSEKTAEKFAEETMKKIIETAEEIAPKIKTLDFDYIHSNERFFSKFFEYSDTCPDIVSFVRGLTNFKYEPFRNISIDGILNASEKLVYVSKISKAFDYPFIEKIDSSWKFDKLEDSFIAFISKNESTTVLEYKLLKSLLGKLVILMCSDVEQSFSVKKPNIRPETRKYLMSYISKMESFGRLKNNISKGWSVFVNTLLNDTEMFNLRNQQQLHLILEQAYSSHFLMESLLANILKTFQTTILVDYFHCVKACFIWVRLVSILIQHNSSMTSKIMSHDELMENIFMISSVVVSMYEDNYFISSMLPKSIPSNDNLSEETILYFLNHSIKGPQYMILKQLENSGPCILNIR